jgi:hypothetical protein
MKRKVLEPAVLAIFRQGVLALFVVAEDFWVRHGLAIPIGGLAHGHEANSDERR